MGVERTEHDIGSGVTKAPSAAARQQAPSGSAAALLRLQRTSGNAAVSALIDPSAPAGRMVPPVVQQQSVPPGGGPNGQGAPAGGGQAGLDEAGRTALAAAGIHVGDDEQQQLATLFPQGLVVQPPQPMIIDMSFGQDRLVGARMVGIRLTTAPRAVGPAVEAWFFQPGKGRAVLVSSIGGGSVLLDAGAGQTMSVSAPSVQRLANTIEAVAAQQTGIPSLIQLSHADADHWNVARALLQRRAFSATAVRITQEQLESAGGWAGVSITAQPDQRVVAVRVTDGGGTVKIDRIVVDNLEITEFRSVAAHGALNAPGATRFNRNRTSPVVVTRDLVTGERMLFTGDAGGRQFDEIVQSIGPTAMSRMLGGPGANLRVVEAPHHFGAQAGPDAVGMINAYELAYESGSADLRLVGQTTRSFSGTGSSTFTFLEAAGEAPERIEGDPSGPGQAQAQRARGSGMSSVTIDVSGMRAMIEQQIDAPNSPMRTARATHLRIESLQRQIAAAREGGQGAAVGALAATEQRLADQADQLRTATRAVFDQMRTVAAGAGGMRSDADLTPIAGAVAAVETVLTRVQPDLPLSESDVSALMSGMALYARLGTNSARMLQALEAENVTELLAARAEHNDLYGRAKVALGAGVVHEHVRAAWAQVRADWPVERFEAETAQGSARIAGRAQSTEFRALLGDTLMRQMQLNQIVAEAEHAGRAVYGPNGEVVVPMSTRVGAGIMAAIEVVRIGLDLVGAYKQGAAATEARTLRTARQGIATVNWWLTIGVEPTVSLATVSSWDQSQLNVVDVPPARAMDAARGGSTDGLPDFDAVVVTGLPGDQLLHVLHRAIAELSTLQDWYTFNRSHPGGDAFRRFDEGWGVRMFSIAAKEYRYTDLEELAPGAVAALDPLITQLEQASSARMDDAVAAAGGATSVKDTAWIFGHDRRVDIYTPGGNPRRIDFDDVRPRFARVSTVADPPGLSGPLILVRAADVPTYRRLAAEYWVEDTGRLGADESGTHHELQVGPNVEGYAFVEPDQLISA